jgi:hypothetical protein
MIFEADLPAQVSDPVPWPATPLAHGVELHRAHSRPGQCAGLPVKHEVNANHEIINGIGVAPDYYLPMTAWDVSTGHDPDTAKALALLRD